MVYRILKIKYEQLITWNEHGFTTLQPANLPIQEIQKRKCILMLKWLPSKKSIKLE